MAIPSNFSSMVVLFQISAWLLSQAFLSRNIGRRTKSWARIGSGIQMGVDCLPLETGNNTLNLWLHLAVIWMPISFQYWKLLFLRYAAIFRFREAWVFIWVLLLGCHQLIIGAELLFHRAVFPSGCVFFDVELGRITKTNFSTFNEVFLGAVLLQLGHIRALYVILLVILAMEERFLLARMVIPGMFAYWSIS